LWAHPAPVWYGDRLGVLDALQHPLAAILGIEAMIDSERTLQGATLQDARGVTPARAIDALSVYQDAFRRKPSGKAAGRTLHCHLVRDETARRKLLNLDHLVSL
jgi:hypothetical protein